MALVLDGTNGITSSGDVTINNGAADGGQVILSSSGYSNWNLDNYSGRFRAYYNATEYFTIDTSGNVGIGGTYSGARVFSKSSTTDSTTYPLLTQNSAGSFLFFVRSDGYTNTGTASQSPYNQTVGSAANTYIHSDGSLQRSTSSLKYKKNVKDAIHGLKEVLQIRPITYESKNELESGKVFGGLIAEEIDAIGLTEFVQYATDGTPDALAYGNMVSLLTKAIQELSAKVEEQAKRIELLESK
jgi:hypothetical protein